MRDVRICRRIFRTAGLIDRHDHHSQTTKCRCLPSEISEYGLRDFLGQMRASTRPAMSGRINQVEMSMDDFSEGALALFCDVAMEQFGIGGHAGSPNNRPPIQKRTKNLPSPRIMDLRQSQRLGFTTRCIRVQLVPRG